MKKSARDITFIVIMDLKIFSFNLKYKTTMLFSKQGGYSTNRVLYVNLLPASCEKVIRITLNVQNRLSFTTSTFDWQCSCHDDCKFKFFATLSCFLSEGFRV